MEDAFRIWANKTKMRKALQRKGEVVAMVVQTVGLLLLSVA
jgi:hypothetical protein